MVHSNTMKKNKNSKYRAGGGWDKIKIKYSSSNNLNIEASQELIVHKLQNKIGEYERIIKNLRDENKTLKGIQQRQEMAILRYEHSKREFPYRVKSFEEEKKYLKSLLNENKRSATLNEQRIKQLEKESSALKDENKRLNEYVAKEDLLTKQSSLQKDMNLSIMLEEKEKEVQALRRHLSKLERSFKRQLSAEVSKCKKYQMAYTENQTRLKEYHMKYQKLKKEMMNSYVYSKRLTDSSLKDPLTAPKKISPPQEASERNKDRKKNPTKRGLRPSYNSDDSMNPVRENSLEGDNCEYSSNFSSDSEDLTEKVSTKRHFELQKQGRKDKDLKDIEKMEKTLRDIHIPEYNE